MNITTIIPHKDYQEYLNQAIISCKNQTYKTNICIVDDCSEDQESVVKIVQSNFELLSIEKQNDLKIYNFTDNCKLVLLDTSYGPSTARNIAIHLFFNETDIFINLDADDEMVNTKVEEFVKAFSLHPLIGVVYADYYTIDTISARVGIEFKKPYNKALLDRECIVHSGAGISKNALYETHENQNFYDPEMRTCEDYDLWMRISEKFTLYHIAKPLTIVRIQPKNSTITVNQEIWNRNYQRVFAKKLARENEKRNNM